MKILNGSELAGFIKERQAHQVRSIRQSLGIIPKLAIILAGDDPLNIKYTDLKKKYGEDIGVDVEVFNINQSDIAKKILELNNDEKVHGIIVQLPLPNPQEIDKIVSHINPVKDVDSLSEASIFDAATPTAILWLLAGYNIELKGKKIVVVGRGRLVGKPLINMLINSDVEPLIVDEHTPNPIEIINQGDVIISAVGKPGLIKSKDLKFGAVVVDAGVASENGVSKGDLEESAYDRNDLILTPQIGGVGPLTVCSLFDNLLKSIDLLR